ncbi:MAG TPA: hypothetical protein VER33_23605 [Polyangiaceae bacterium]|nr:hypothetical protein [Polyangiaceae bacterium]
MIARAPGKVVLSGAYAVLGGAPALVAAVDRYVYADATRPAHFVTPEVSAALAGRGTEAPWFDATALRDGARKLGLGSSAAILVASLAALELRENASLTPNDLAERLFQRALSAHARAQGGGSGIDVAASTHGGVLLARREAQTLNVSPVRLPAGLQVRVLAAEQPASTPQLVARVADLGRRDPALHESCMRRQREASESAAAAALAGDAGLFLDSLRAQHAALRALGEAAGISIVTPEVEALARAATERGAAALPAGAGGGDIAVWVGALDVELPVTPGLSPLDLRLGATGVARAD